MTTRTIVHHLYRNPSQDLLPVCGTIPGPDSQLPHWHTGHSADYLVAYRRGGHPVCTTCYAVAVGSLEDAAADEDLGVGENPFG